MTTEDDAKPSPRDVPAGPRRPRPAGTYAAHYERGADARTGQSRLVAFVLTSVLLETCWLGVTLRGGASWGDVLLAGGRMLVTWALLVALWSGAGWTRWGVAAINFGFGGWVALHALISGLGVYLPFLPSTLVPLERAVTFAAGSFYLVAAAWFAFSADLEAFVVRQHAGMTRGDRRAVVALLALCLALPLAGGALWAAQAWAAAGREAAAWRVHAEGVEVAVRLIREAMELENFSRLEERLTPTEREALRERAGQDWAERGRERLTEVGRPLRWEATDRFPAVKKDGRRELFCNVIATCERGTMVFHCYLEQTASPPGWRFQDFSVE